MATKFSCPKCYKQISTNILKINEEFSCPNCNALIVLPINIIEEKDSKFHTILKKYSNSFLTMSIDKPLLIVYFFIISPLWTLLGFWSTYDNLEKIRVTTGKSSFEYNNFFIYAIVLLSIELFRTIYSLLAGIKLINHNLTKINYAISYMKFYIIYWIIIPIIFNYWFDILSKQLNLITGYSYTIFTAGQILGAVITYFFINRSLNLLKNKL